jgi:uncharacterized protein (DUF433 family)
MDQAKTGGKYQDRILRDPEICGGEPVFKGTRVTLRSVLGQPGRGRRPGRHPR